MVVYKWYVVQILVLFLCLDAQSQNLVINGSFEDILASPEEKGDLVNYCEGIYAASRGSTDYFTACGAIPVGVPNNFMGEQVAFDGNAYAGLYLFSPNNYREYIQFKLKKTLERGKIYKLSMRLSLAEKSAMAIQNLSALFTQDQVYVDTNENLSPNRLQSFNIKKFSYIPLGVRKSIFKPESWGVLEVEFEAKGYEKYLTFGNFKDDRNSRVTSVKEKTAIKKPTSYYYIDDVKVEFSKESMFAHNKPFVLDALQFEYDSFKLTKEAKREIADVFKYLKQNPKIKLDISGHTDDLGGSVYNKYLSSRRARAVALYLQELGLSENQVSWEGKGDKEPLKNGNSNKARKTNRRVEFVITKFEDF